MSLNMSSCFEVRGEWQGWEDSFLPAVQHHKNDKTLTDVSVTAANTTVQLISYTKSWRGNFSEEAEQNFKYTSIFRQDLCVCDPSVRRRTQNIS